MAKTILILLTALWLMEISVRAVTTQPLTAIQRPIDAVIAILKSPKYKDPALKEAQYNQIRSIIEDVFNFEMISQRAVGRYWKKFKPDERKVFTGAFSELLVNSYIQKIQGEFQNESVAYLGERALSKGRVMVQTKIIRDNIDIPVDYSMQMIDNVWKVYDVNVEGVSLVKNYRTQFSKLLLKESPMQLIQRIEAKIEKQKTTSEK